MFSETEQRQLALKLRLGAKAEDTQSSDFRRREIAIARRNPRSAFQTVDMLPGNSADSTKLSQLVFVSLPTGPFQEGCFAKLPKEQETLIALKAPRDSVPS